MAVELAKVVGEGGHVHAVDVNADFIARAQAVADEAGVGGSITFHHALDERIPLPDASVDRVYCKNVLEYVPDLDHTLREIARVLRPGGVMVASDSDFGFVVVEPLDADEVRELFLAAAPAFKEPNVGRKLRNAYRRAGLGDVTVEIVALADEKGMLRGVLENMLGYGTKFGNMTETRATELRDRFDAALASGDYFVALPQWWVRGTKR